MLYEWACHVRKWLLECAGLLRLAALLISCGRRVQRGLPGKPALRLRAVLIGLWLQLHLRAKLMGSRLRLWAVLAGRRLLLGIWPQPCWLWAVFTGHCLRLWLQLRAELAGRHLWLLQAHLVAWAHHAKLSVCAGPSTWSDLRVAMYGLSTPDPDPYSTHLVKLGDFVVCPNTVYIVINDFKAL